MTGVFSRRKCVSYLELLSLLEMTLGPSFCINLSLQYGDLMAEAVKHSILQQIQSHPQRPATASITV